MEASDVKDFFHVALEARQGAYRKLSGWNFEYRWIGWTSASSYGSEVDGRIQLLKFMI